MVVFFLYLAMSGVDFSWHSCNGLIYKVSGISLQEFNYPAAIYAPLIDAQTELLADSFDLFTT